MFFYTGHTQTTINIDAAADNTIYQNQVGNSNALGQNIFSGTTNAGSIRRGLIRFNIAGNVPAGATITAATLTLNCNVSRSNPDTVKLHRLTATWGEGTSDAGAGPGDGNGTAATTNDATWESRFFSVSNWATTGGDYVATASAQKAVPTTGFVTWSSAGMINDIQGWLNTPSSNAGWILICDEVLFPTARKFGSRENATVANRPSLQITYTLPIPVTLTYFNAKTANGNVILNWETAQEINNHHFEIQHSLDGINFYSIGIVLGNNNSTILRKYQYTDQPVQAGVHFYRLAQVDNNGSKHFSVIVQASLSKGQRSFSVFPNPVRNKLNLPGWLSPGIYFYKITDLQGMLISQGKTGTDNIDVSRLSAGNYQFSLYRNDALTGQCSFIKQ
jgi:hypothetical protein